jgi:hypothetical protein
MDVLPISMGLLWTAVGDLREVESGIRGLVSFLIGRCGKNKESTYLDLVC